MIGQIRNIQVQTMRPRDRFFSLILALYLATIAPAFAQKYTQKVPADADTLSVRFFSYDTGIHIRFFPAQINGQLALCGAYAVEGRSSSIRRIADNILKRLTFASGGRVLRTSAVNFTKVGEQGALTHAIADCRLTGQPWGQGVSFIGPFEFAYNDGGSAIDDDNLFFVTVSGRN